ncbi:ATP-dependent transcriptional regulator [Pseudomonas laurylsulfatiphila]|uniref:ATP-dependent transcriptional regulator n=2 Tax=Pseudomonas laurylsulfatiphila TaxID=2011015 RepID=A0A2S6FQ12_9PSED|nr:LuxR C-terminal-related transcriptional regulator [Pseudomonas laurylsulfatiphila]PPK39564.1 ATP-dependent transcriptional regulator [Pseudomonas laurylsulfatiphila]
MFVPRPHLIDALEGKPCRLQLLCAPAGYGKTSLVQQYLQGIAPPGAVVWMALGGQRQTLERFIAKLAGALGLPVDTAPDGVLAFLDSGLSVPVTPLSRAGSLLQLTVLPCGSEPAREEARAANEFLQEEHRSESRPIRLVLDDLPVEMPADLNHWFDRLLSLNNRQLQVLVTCRQRPDWNLPRLMLTGQLLEFGARQLALRPDEFESLIDALAPHTDALARGTLWHETGGWCAGVRLSLSLDHARPSPLLGQYLERELLSRLSDEQREVMGGMAHLSRVSADFCEQLWEGRQAAWVFNSLLECHAFVFPLEQQPGWFRLLPAVAQALQSHLSGAPLNRLRLRACQLLSVLGHVDDAVEQALCADQPEVAANYMERLWLSWILRERHLNKLMEWRERIEPQLLHSSLRLIYLCAKALLFSGRLDEAAECLARLGHFLPLPDPVRNQRLLANWQALFGTLQALRGQAGPARLHCRAALDYLGGEDWLSVLLCHCILARLAMGTGDLAQAQTLLDHSLELARRRGSHESEVLVNADRVRLMMLRGQAGFAQALLRTELDRLAPFPSQPYPLLGRLLFLRGELLLQQGHCSEAEVVIQAGLLQVRDCCAPFVLNAYLLLAEIASRNHDPEKAHLLLHEAERRMQWGKIDSALYQAPIARQKNRILAREQPAETGHASVTRLSAGVPDYQDDLTPREVSVLKLLAEGMSVREVGSRLFISENTVKTHAKNINVKLGACRRTQAINSAKAMGILA